MRFDHSCLSAIRLISSSDKMFKMIFILCLLSDSISLSAFSWLNVWAVSFFLSSCSSPKSNWNFSLIGKSSWLFKIQSDIFLRSKSKISNKKVLFSLFWFAWDSCECQPMPFCSKAVDFQWRSIEVDYLPILWSPNCRTRAN